MLLRQQFYACILICFLCLALLVLKFDHVEKAEVVSKVGFLIDLEILNDMASSLGFDVYAFDRNFVSLLNNTFISESTPASPILWGFDAKYLDTLQFLPEFESLELNNVKVEIFFNNKPLMNNFGFKQDSPIGFVMQKNYIHFFHVLYPREDNTWWYGNLASDQHCPYKLKKFFMDNKWCDASISYENILDRFEIALFNDYSHIFIPQNSNNFISQLENSKFIECNYSRAEIFKKSFMHNLSSSDVLFKHRAWKVLSKAKIALDLLSIPFWLSSGTCLGYYRECDIIPYSRDVDIGVFAKDYNEKITSFMESHGLMLKHWFGQPNDSLELSFVDNGGIKLDIFFFYEENDYIWNGGTQLKTGRKFKYIFPKISLCWTLFRGLKIRIPCETEAYIVANYGKNWFKPIRDWDWKSSPSNVQSNGFWPPFILKRSYSICGEMNWPKHQAK